MKATIILTGEAKQRAYEMYLQMQALYKQWQNKTK
jgi:hypothetical protein